jgi:hypothetical protein
MNYAPALHGLPALSRGFSIKRVYESVDDPSEYARPACDAFFGHSHSIVTALHRVDVGADGSIKVRAGARVRVRLVITTQLVRHHVALKVLRLLRPPPAGMRHSHLAIRTHPAQDMLPAGLEPLNPELKQAGDDYAQQSNNSRKAILLELLALGRGYAVGLLTGWEGRWFDHQELKDDRCEAFTAYLAPGVYEYTYLTRATTLGVFIAPPPKVPPPLPLEEGAN